MTELKPCAPCPFCGASTCTARRDNVAYFGGLDKIVLCQCRACGPNKATEIEAIAAWNTRAESAAESFEEVWAKTGFLYGKDALDGVKLGWNLAKGNGPTSEIPRSDVEEARAIPMTTTPSASGTDEALVEEIARTIREHHRTHVRQPDRTNEPRRTFHQGDEEAARAILPIISRERNAVAPLYQAALRRLADYAKDNDEQRRELAASKAKLLDKYTEGFTAGREYAEANNKAKLEAAEEMAEALRNSAMLNLASPKGLAALAKWECANAS